MANSCKYVGMGDVLELIERQCYITGMILLRRIEPADGMNRWYLVAIQPTLFHPCAVVIAWGRRDNDFQQWRVIPVESEAQAQEMAGRIVARKVKRGYQPHQVE